MDCIVHGITKSQTWLSDFHFHFHSWLTMLLIPIIQQSDSVSRRRQWQATLVLLPRKSLGWRSLVGCSPWGHYEYESDSTEQLHFHFSLSCIGEGNGNSLQCSCLENPRDGGAWWAAVYAVTQSWTWLKQFSSSCSSIYMYQYIFILKYSFPLWFIMLTLSCSVISDSLGPCGL